MEGIRLLRTGGAGLLLQLLVLLPAAAADQGSKTGSADSRPAKDASTSEQAHAHRPIVGWVERIRLEPEGLLLDAKLTPGSEGSMIHVDDPETYRKDGTEWVRFSLTDRKGKTKRFERKIIDQTRFRNSNGEIKERFIVRSGFCLDKTYLEVEFALGDRSSFEQEVRLGRETIAGQFIVDPAKSRTTHPNCDMKNLEK